jgi:NAD(P)-dependent dehydrogenase (short-subunit alcohol dehydrogenase family)
VGFAPRYPRPTGTAAAAGAVAFAMDMTSKVALVTGAGRGLGWGIARAMAQAGARVLLTDVEDDDLGRAVAGIADEAAARGAAGGAVVGRHLDAGDADDVERAVDELLARWGRIDAFVHAGVVMPLVRFDAMTLPSWQRVFDVGLGGLVHGARATRAAMRRQGGGHLIGVASGASLRGYHDEVAYCAMKHALEGFVKALALESEGDRIAVNTIGPGKPIKPTRMTWAEAERVPAEERATWADPTDLGRAFVWLACQAPERFSGLRFDAGPIVDAIEREGAAFEVVAEKVTLYPDDWRARAAWRAAYPG